MDFIPPPDLWLPPKPAIIRHHEPDPLLLGVIPGLPTPSAESLLSLVSAPSFYGSASNLTTYTFSNCAIGAAHPDRTVIVCLSSNFTGLTRTLSSVTIGGVAATIAFYNGDSDDGVGLAYALVPSGTTANVVVTMSGGVSMMGIGVWNARTKSTNRAPSDIGGPFGLPPLADTMTVWRGGFMIAFAGVYKATLQQPTFTWGGTDTWRARTGIHVATGEAGQQTVAGADFQATVNQGPLAVGWSASGAGWGTAAFGSWR